MGNTITPLIDMTRIDQVTEIGVVDGGEWADVLAVTYAPQETLIRVRFEKTGERHTYRLSPEQALSDVLTEMSRMLVSVFPLPPTTRPVIYRGHQARKWVKRMISRAVKDAESQRTLIGKTNEGLPIFKTFIQVPYDQPHETN